METQYLQDLGSKQLGHVGELLTEMKLNLWGFEATACHNHALPYDLLVFHEGFSYRIQVKATSKKEIGKNGYKFSVKQGATKRAYEKGAYDLLCLVCLSKDKIMFMTPPHTKNKYVLDCVFEQVDEKETFVKSIGKIRAA